MSVLTRRTNLIRSLIIFCYLVAGCAPGATATPSPSPRATATPLTPTATDTAADTPTNAPTRTGKPTVRANTPTSTITATRVPSLAATKIFLPTRIPPTARPTPVPATPTQPPPPPVALHATELVFIPTGTLTMGTSNNEAGDPDERPQHFVTVYAFSIERYEVTNGQYQACVAARVCPPSAGTLNPAGANFPIVNITWYGANAYCKWIGRRLPNEAEWERAGRGVDNWRYTFSNSLGMPFEWNAIYHGSPLSFCEASCPLTNYWGSVNDGYAYTAAVGSFGYDASKGFGVMDMNGNVSEWVSNWYDPNAYSDGNDVYGPAAPTGAKVYRGGSWATEPLRLADRNSLAPDLSSNLLGFRCAA